MIALARAAGLAVALVAAGSAAAAESVAAREISRARALLDQAERALAGAAADADRLAALGLAVRGHEAALGALRTGIRALVAEERALGQGLNAERGGVEAMLGALQRISRAPQSVLLAYPGGPLEAARAASLVAEITPALAAEMTTLEDQLSRLAVVRTAQEDAAAQAAGTLAALQSLRAEASRAVRRKKPVAEAEAITAQAATAAALARDLDDLSIALEQGVTQPGTAAPFAGRRGALIPPVAGRITGIVGGVDPWGRTGQGVTFTAPAYAQVVAPADATVLFVDPLVDYGHVVVLEPEPGWLIVMAGLAGAERTPGDAVLAGEPIGTLGGPLPSSEEFLLEAERQPGQITQETLYVELRRDGEPVDPAPWFGNEWE